MRTNERMYSYGQNAPAIFSAVVLVVAAVFVAWLGIDRDWLIAGIVSLLLAIAAVLLPLSLLMAQQWEKAVVLRFGKLHSIRGPGMFVVVPFVDTIAAWIDQRIQTIEFNAEQALT